MTTYYFAVQDLDEEFDADIGLDLPDLPCAINYARRALSDMALDGIPTVPGARQAVTVLGPDRIPIAIVSLRISIDWCDAKGAVMPGPE